MTLWLSQKGQGVEKRQVGGADGSAVDLALVPACGKEALVAELSLARLIDGTSNSSWCREKRSLRLQLF